MNRRALIAAFAALLALPASGSAQVMELLDDPTWMPWLRITPFVGYLTSVDRTEEWAFRSGTQQGSVQSEMQIGGGKAAGLSADVSVWGPVGVNLAVAYASRSETVFGVASAGDILRLDGNRVFMARLGPGLVLSEETTDDLTLRRLNASAFAGGVVMHERPKNNLGTADFINSATSFGVGVGITAELPFANDRLAIQLGAEDNYMWWSDAQSEMIAREYFVQKGTGSNTIGEASVENAMTWLLRAGVTFRFR